MSAPEDHYESDEIEGLSIEQIAKLNEVNIQLRKEIKGLHQRLRNAHQTIGQLFQSLATYAKVDLLVMEKLEENSPMRTTNK